MSLVDASLAEEVELTALLIVAANESEIPLPRHEVDTILGIAPRPEILTSALRRKADRLPLPREGA